MTLKAIISTFAGRLLSTLAKPM